MGNNTSQTAHEQEEREREREHNRTTVILQQKEIKRIKNTKTMCDFMNLKFKAQQVFENNNYFNNRVYNDSYNPCQHNFLFSNGKDIYIVNQKYYKNKHNSIKEISLLKINDDSLKYLSIEKKLELFKLNMENINDHSHPFYENNKLMIKIDDNFITIKTDTINITNNFIMYSAYPEEHEEEFECKK
ncbi:hypothetical protein OAA60_06270 [Porticoccaceae bacterium]|nr:hypothetical protein [Porticoccaceae bacterium]